jgi:hypothetical protein
MGLVALGADGALSLRAIAARYAPAVEVAPQQPLTFDLGETT